MRPLKRPRSSTSSVTPDPIYIDLISDDEHSSIKRQRSVPSTETPQSTPYVNERMSTQARTDITQISIQAQSTPIQTHKSPFENTPPGLKIERTVIEDDDDETSVQNDTVRPSVEVQSRQVSQIMSPPHQAAKAFHQTQGVQNAPAVHFRLSEVQPLRFDTSANAELSPSFKNLGVSPPVKLNASPSLSLSLSSSKPLAASHQTSMNSLKSTLAVRSSSPGLHKFSSSQEDSQKAPLFQRNNKASPSKPKPVVHIPLSRKRLRETIMEKLYIDPSLAQRDPEYVDEYVGKNGFSRLFLPPGPARVVKPTGPRKQRSVDRSQIPLDIPDAIPVIDTGARKMNFVHPREQVRALFRERLEKENFDPPLAFSNTINDRLLHGKFQFISKNVNRLPKPVKAPSKFLRVRCTATCGAGDCGDGCSHLPTSDGQLDMHGEPMTEMIVSYRKRADGLVVLTEAQLGENSEVVECDDDCPCSRNCINRVVQRGRTLPLEIFYTGLRGFGVRSRQDIVRGQFIEVYLGEILTREAMTLREQSMNSQPGDASYVYDLDWFPEVEVPHHIDARNFGTAMRYVNHSCDANTRSIPVMHRDSSREVHSLAFFAVKDIPANSEITIDYNPQPRPSPPESDDSDDDEGPNTNENSPEPDSKANSKANSDTGSEAELSIPDSEESIAKCLCGATKCRGTYWPINQSEKSRRKRVRTLN